MANDVVNAISSYLSYLKTPVTLHVDVDASNAGLKMKELAEGLANASELIEVSHTTLKRKPSIGISTRGEAPRVVFSAFPSGHETTSFLLALLNIGGHPSKEDPELIAKAASISKKLDIEVYVSMSCHNCPDVVQAANLIATVNKHVNVKTIDGGLFKDEVESEGIYSVPSMYVNGEHFKNGKITLSEMLNMLDDKYECIEEPNTSSVDDNKVYDMTIAGTGPGGLMAAIYAARKGLNVALIGDDFGGQLLQTEAIENVIGFPSTTGEELAQNIRKQTSLYDIDLFEGKKVKGALFDKNHVLSLDSGKKITTKTTIIATGARWKKLNIPGEDAYMGKGVCFCPHCDGPLFKGKDVAVIGAGNSGIEAAIDLSNIVKKVYVIVRSDTMRADKVLVDKLMTLSNVEVVYEATPKEIVGESKMTGVKVIKSGEDEVISVDGVFVQIGLVPNTDWLSGTGVDLDDFGNVKVNHKQETNVNGVFAIGDVTDTYNQIVIAVGQGASASLRAFDYLIRN